MRESKNASLRHRVAHLHCNTMARPRQFTWMGPLMGCSGGTEAGRLRAAARVRIQQRNGAAARQEQFHIRTSNL